MICNMMLKEKSGRNSDTIAKSLFISKGTVKSDRVSTLLSAVLHKIPFAE